MWTTAGAIFSTTSAIKLYLCRRLLGCSWPETETESMSWVLRVTGGGPLQNTWIKNPMWVFFPHRHATNPSPCRIPSAFSHRRGRKPCYASRRARAHLSFHSHVTGTQICHGGGSGATAPAAFGLPPDQHVDNKALTPTEPRDGKAEHGSEGCEASPDATSTRLRRQASTRPL